MAHHPYPDTHHLAGRRSTQTINNSTDQGIDAIERRPVERAANFQLLVADTAVVEPIHNQITISFVAESMRPSSVQWEKDDDQPSGIGRKRLVEEVTAVRMLPEAANALALELLVELARIGLSRESFETNFGLVRDELDRRDAADQGTGDA